MWENWASAEREGGFDAVVGNPPWDRLEFAEVPWFEARNREISLAPTGAVRKAKIKALKNADDSLWTEYEKASGRLIAGTRVVRSGEIYSKLNVGKLNLFKLFVERAFQLAKPNGIIGMLTPSGIASDQSSSEFFRNVATNGHLKALYDFENKKVFFPDVHASFKFCTLIASPKRTFSAAKCAFFLRRIDEISDPERAFPITADEFARVNPNTGTAPIFQSRRDMALTTMVYEGLPVLLNRSGEVVLRAWPVRYAQMLNVTSDSHLFRTTLEMEEAEGAWSIGGNHFETSNGEWVPLYEGKMVQAFDHRAASVVINPDNLKRPAQSVEATPTQLAERLFGKLFLRDSVWAGLVIQARDVERAEPWPDGQDRPEDQAVSV